MNLRRTLQALLALGAVGLAISLYLSYEYLTNQTPICSGSTGCAVVQNSPYSWVGPVRVPVLGAVGYALLMVLSLLALLRPRLQQSAVLMLFGGTLAGLLYSAYLTYLELFVILAICRWCVGSAVVMALMFILSLVAYRQVNLESPE